MTNWTIKSTQDDASWFDDLVIDVLDHEPAPLPPNDAKWGHVETHWHQVRSGVAYVYSNPETGSADDRRLAEALVVAQLEPHGFKRATWEYRYDHSDMTKTATWADIEAKARRLIQGGAVQLLRNGYNTIIGQVQGDHGNYKTEISRDDPNSQAISGSTCECDWGQFQNLPRTRQWKRFQDRPCAHILAAYWQSKATPLDEDRNPGGQMSMPGMGGPMSAPSSMPLMQAPQSPSAAPMAPGGPGPQGMPGPAQMSLGDPSGGMQAPSPEDVLPQFPMDPSLVPQHNPASIPGGNPGPTPTNPIQYPGGTFSKVAHINGDIVQLLNDDYGTLVGRSEAHGAGQQTPIAAGQMGEVLGTHPSTGMVNVLYMGKPFEQNGPLMPYGAQAWHFPSDVVARPDVKKPGPAIRRSR